MKTKGMLTTREVMDRYRVGRWTVWNWVHTGKLVPVVVDGMNYHTKKNLQELERNGLKAGIEWAKKHRAKAKKKAKKK